MFIPKSADPESAVQAIPQPPTDGASQRIDASSISVPKKATSAVPQVPTRLEPPAFASALEGALWWFGFGYNVIPMLPGAKMPAVKHATWLEGVSVAAITAHWERHPSHDVGAVLDSNQIVIDADTDEANAAMRQLEDQFGVVPSLVIKTRRGIHHHFRLDDGVFAKADSHSTDKHPDRIDIRAGKNSVLLTPSQNKAVEILKARHRDELVSVSQDFVDAVFHHNGRSAPRPYPEMVEVDPEPNRAEVTQLSQLLAAIDPDCGYQDWLSALMAIYHETGGSPEGLALADSWSKRGSSYKGRADVEAKWRSFQVGVANPVTVATLVARAREGGADIGAIMHEDFMCHEEETIVVPAASAMPRSPSPTPPAGRVSQQRVSPLRKYSLLGQAAKDEALAQAATPLLGELCLHGEATVWYAKHNTGKTLIFLHLAIEAIEQQRLKASDLFFINADDSSAGIAVKLGILDEFGAHMLVPGQSGFKAENLQELLTQAVRNDAARGSLVVIDTLKKFADLMNKKQASEFANICRQFVSAGGTVLGLAHVNKKLSDEGKAIHAGTTDILDDFDAGYIIDELPSTGQPGERFVEFTRLKGRGGGIAAAAYAYAAEDHVSYAERLASVRLVDQDDLESFKRVEEARSDADMIAAVASCIGAGTTTKMALRNAVAEQLNVSRRAATKVIERYTGDDPLHHHWSFSRKAHGAKSFELLDRTSVQAGSASPPPS